MYCPKCGANLIEGVCPFCIEEHKLDERVETKPLVNRNKALEQIALTFSIISVIISIIPIHEIVIIFGIVLALVASGVALKLRLKYRSNLIAITIILSHVSVISLLFWVYFLNFIVHKL